MVVLGMETCKEATLETVAGKRFVQCFTVCYTVAVLHGDVTSLTVAAYNAIHITSTLTVIGGGVKYGPWRTV